MLKVNNVEVIYANVIVAVRGISLVVPTGRIVCLLGANGAGKSTTLKAISGLLYSETGSITEGNIEFNGNCIDKLSPQDIVKLGIVQVMEGSQILKRLTVYENLRAGAYIAASKGSRLRRDFDMVYEYFPRLKELINVVSGYCSGGERQMLVMARALMSHPKVMLLDEPSLGLSPMLVQEIFEIIKNINTEEKSSILLVEQNAAAALQIAEYGYVMENGRVVLSGAAADLRENEDVKEFYLGLSRLGERKSYREVKYYTRRKRWLG